MKGATSWHSSLPQKGEHVFLPSSAVRVSHSSPRRGEFCFGEGLATYRPPSHPATCTLCRFSLPAIYRRQIVKVYVRCCAVFASSSLNDRFLSEGRSRKAFSPPLVPQENMMRIDSSFGRELCATNINEFHGNYSCCSSLRRRRMKGGKVQNILKSINNDLFNIE